MLAGLDLHINNLLSIPAECLTVYTHHGLLERFVVGSHWTTSSHVITRGIGESLFSASQACI
jgi:hypothetical protein